MNYAALRAAVYERRFPSNSPVANWLEAAYNDVWNGAEWTFKKVQDATFYTTTDGLVGGSASRTPKTPTDFANVVDLYDDQGEQLEWLTGRQYRQRYQPYTATGRPEAFAVVNRQVYLGPTPSSAFSFDLSYKRRLAVRDGSSVVKVGFMVADDDQPLWDDHAYLLVLRAKLIGLRDRSDPTASDLEGEYARLLAAMKEEYVEQGPIGRQLPAWR